MTKYAEGVIVKIDEDKRLVFGWASIIKDVAGKILLDRQDDFIDSDEELEKAAYEYVLKSRDGGEMHIRKGVSTMIESVVLSEEKQRALGIPAGIVPIGWWVGFKVSDTSVWNEVKKGGYIGFSVHGTGQRHSTEVVLADITEVEKGCGCDTEFAVPTAISTQYDPAYWTVMRKAQEYLAARAIKKGDLPGHDFRGNQWTKRGSKGGGGKGGGSKRQKTTKVTDIGEAITRILAGESVELANVSDVSTVLEKLAAIAKDAKARGEDAPKYDLCGVSLAGTNLFCGHKLRNKKYPNGVPRIKMPQVGGEPEKGSIAEGFPRNPWDKKEVNGADAFVAHLSEQGISAKKTSMPVASLKASQAELVGAKVAKMMVDKGFDVTSNPIFVSRDGYIVDGHHRWAAAVGRDAADGKLGDVKINVIRLDAPIAEVLHLANKWAKKVGLRGKSGK